MAALLNAVTLRLTLDGSMGRTTFETEAMAPAEVAAAVAAWTKYARHQLSTEATRNAIIDGLLEQPAPRCRWLVPADLRGAVARRRRRPAPRRAVHPGARDHCARRRRLPVHDDDRSATIAITHCQIRRWASSLLTESAFCREYAILPLGPARGCGDAGGAARGAKSQKCRRGHRAMTAQCL